MKTIGLLGGMSWESTVSYYQIINREVQRRLGGFHSARCVLYSVEFAEIEALQAAGRWEEAGTLLAHAAKGLQAAGAEFVCICTNTMHKVAPAVADAISVPLLHIADATAEALLQQNMQKVALLGTRYTMEQDFYTKKLQDKGLQVSIPGAQDREKVNNIIFKELCLGQTREASRQYMLRLVQKLAGEGAQGIILGCTEIGILVQQKDTNIPLFDTAHIHALQAARFSLE